MPCNWYCFLYVLAILIMIALSIPSIMISVDVSFRPRGIWVVVLGGLQAAAIVFYAVISCCCCCGHRVH